jgi:hypothetical protein
MSGIKNSDAMDEPEPRRQISDDDAVPAAVEMLMTEPVEGGGWISGPCRTNSTATEE